MLPVCPTCSCRGNSCCKDWWHHHNGLASPEQYGKRMSGARPILFSEIGILREKVAHFCQHETVRRIDGCGVEHDTDARNAVDVKLPCTKHEGHGWMCAHESSLWREAQWLATIDDLRAQVLEPAQTLTRLVDRLSGE